MIGGGRADFAKGFIDVWSDWEKRDGIGTGGLGGWFWKRELCIRFRATLTRGSEGCVWLGDGVGTSIKIGM